MLTGTDLIHVEYTPDLTEAGILSACQWLASTNRNLDRKPYNLLRWRIGQVIVDLALKRLLAERKVPFQRLPMEPFSDPLQYKLSLAGHRLHLNSCLISDRMQIRSLQKNPAKLMQASALAPLDQVASEAQTGRDIYLFAFLLALTAGTQVDQRRLETTKDPRFYLALLPKPWSHPASWVSLNPITIKSEAQQPVHVELGGLNADRRFNRVQMQLQPLTSTTVPGEFFSLAYIHSVDHPKARLGVHSLRVPHSSALHIIQPFEWGNIWIYGLDIWLLGWLSLDEYRTKAVVLPAGQKTFQYSRTRTKNLSVPGIDLKPVEDLFEQTLAWQALKLKTL